MEGAPVWLLDIDGVVNAPTLRGRKPPTHVWPEADWIDTEALGADRRWRIVVARPVVEFVRAVHEAGRAEIRWHTTWQDFAHNVSDVLDWPRFPVQEAPEFYAQGESLKRDQWWKLPAAWRVLAEGRKVLWTDDDAKTELRPEQKTTLAAAGCHIISPDPYAGLTRKHLRQIDEHLPTAGEGT